MILDQALHIPVTDTIPGQQVDADNHKEIMHAKSTTSITDLHGQPCELVAEQSPKIYRMWNKKDEYVAFSTRSGIYKLHIVDGDPTFVPVAFKSSYPLISAGFTNNSVVVLASKHLLTPVYQTMGSFGYNTTNSISQVRDAFGVSISRGYEAKHPQSLQEFKEFAKLVELEILKIEQKNLVDMANNYPNRKGEKSGNKPKLSVRLSRYQQGGASLPKIDTIKELGLSSRTQEILLREKIVLQKARPQIKRESIKSIPRVSTIAHRLSFNNKTDMSKDLQSVDSHLAPMNPTLGEIKASIDQSSSRFIETKENQDSVDMDKFLAGDSVPQLEVLPTAPNSLVLGPQSVASLSNAAKLTLLEYASGNQARHMWVKIVQDGSEKRLIGSVFADFFNKSKADNKVGETTGPVSYEEMQIRNKRRQVDAFMMEEGKSEPAAGTSAAKKKERIKNSGRLLAKMVEDSLAQMHVTQRGLQDQIARCKSLLRMKTNGAMKSAVRVARNKNSTEVTQVNTSRTVKSTAFIANSSSMATSTAEPSMKGEASLRLQQKIAAIAESRQSRAKSRDDWDRIEQERVYLLPLTS